MKIYIFLAMVAAAQAGLLPAAHLAVAPVATHVDVAPAVHHIKAPAVVETGVSSQYRSQDSLGNYAFSYDEDHTSGGSFRRESGDATGKVVGSYGLKDADGRQRIVNYVADEDGFRANIQTNEPGVEAKDPADVKINKPEAIEEVVVAKPVVTTVKETPVAIVKEAPAVVEAAPAPAPEIVAHVDQPVTTVKVESPGAVTYTTTQKAEPVEVAAVPQVHHASAVIPDVHHTTAVKVVPQVHHASAVIPDVHHTTAVKVVPQVHHASAVNVVPTGVHHLPAIPHTFPAVHSYAAHHPTFHYISPFSAAYSVAPLKTVATTKVATLDDHHVPTVKYAVKPTVLAGSPFAYYPHIVYHP